MPPALTRQAPKYKVLRSAAHNFSDSFASIMNGAGADAVSDYIATISRRSGERVLKIDFLTRAISPSNFCIPEIEHSVAHYAQWLPEFLRSSGFPADHLRRVRTIITILPEDKPVEANSPYIIPFGCQTRIMDDRGKFHSGGVHGYARFVEMA